jgi:hypothetical protein
MIYSESFPVEGFLLQVKAPHHTTPHQRIQKSTVHFFLKRCRESTEKKLRVYVYLKPHSSLFYTAEKPGSQSKFRNTGQSQADHKQDGRRKRNGYSFQWR